MRDYVVYQLRGQVAWVTMNHPETHNALGGPLTGALDDALNRAIQDSDARMIVLTGAGKTFSAGLDLKGDVSGFVSADQTEELPPFQSIVKRLWHSPKPVIGRVQGSAFGGGVGLMLCCDVVLTVPQAVFIVSELRVGVPPTTIPLMLHHKGLIGRMRPMILAGQQFDSREAMDLGLVHKIAEPVALDEAVDAYCKRFMGCAPQAYAVAKEIQRGIPGMSFETGLRYVTDQLRRATATGEAAEGRVAFQEKRNPYWNP